MYFFFLTILFLFIYLLLARYMHALTILALFEFIWIILFSFFLFLAFYKDSFYILSLTFFILVFSSAEVSIGFVLFSVLQASGVSLNQLRIITRIKNFKSTFSSIK